jgi:hypothetical protein
MKFGIDNTKMLIPVYPSKRHKTRIKLIVNPIGTNQDIIIFSSIVTFMFWDVTPCNIVRTATGIMTNQVGIVIINQFKLIISSSLKAHSIKNPPNIKFGTKIELNSPKSIQLSI